MSMLKLRDYQADAITAVRKAWGDGTKRPAIVLPTGAGKTVVFAHLVAAMHGRGVKTVILAHRDELISQAADKLRAVAPDLRIGIFKAEKRETENVDAIVASIQSLTRRERREQLANAGVRLVIIDECHHAVSETYMSVLRDLGCFEDDPLSGAYALGVTATLGRSDRVALGQAWQEVAYSRGIIDMIREGYLVNAKGVRVRIEGLDLSSVKRSRGDWQEGALADAMHESLAPAAIARAYLEHAAERQGIVFAPTVEMAYEIAEEFTAAGISCEGIDGTTPIEVRRDLLRRYARGDVQVLANCMVLTEGFDAPWCSAVVIARPTSSAPLYIQMAGRALRPHPGKRDAIVLDVVGVTGRHRLASIADLAGADRAEKLEGDLAAYTDMDELDLLGIADAAAAAAEPGADGPLSSEIVDLFGTRRQSWLRTQRGVWFLQSGDQVVFLAPDAEPGRYCVARCPMKGKGGEFLQTGVDLDMAMSWGEQYATEDTAVLTRKGARWRAAPPSEGQKATAARMGLPLMSTKGEMSDALSTFIVSRRIDSMPAVSTVTERGYW